MSWKKSTIGDVLSVIRNGINCEQNKIPVGEKITRIETIAKKRFDFERVGYANLTESEKERGQLKDGDILFSHINSPIHVGKTAIYEGEEDIYHGINLLLMRTNKDVNPYFFNQFLNHLFATGYWEANCKKSVNQASVNQKDISKVEFNYPPLATQKKIVAKLDAIFAEIDKATAAAEANAKNAEALFQSYLTKVFEGESDKWKEMKIRDLGRVVTGNTPKTAEAENYGNFIPFVKPGDFKNDGSIDLDKQKLSEIGMSKSRVIKEKSALMVCIGATIGKCGFTEVDVVTNQQINSVTPASQFNHKFIYLQMLTNQFQKYVKDGAGQATLPIINKSKWESLVLKFPPLNEQIEIVKEFDGLRLECDKLKSTEYNKMKNLNLLKDSVLKKAFSGELVKE